MSVRDRKSFIINEDGLVVDRRTGEVVGQVVEGTLDKPARPMPSDLASLNRRGVFAIGVRPMGNNREFEEWVSKVESVLTKHGVGFHRSQVEELTRRLRAIGSKASRLVEVLDCVLDAECIKYGPELRVPVERAFEEVFGAGSLVKAQIASELRRGGFDGLLSVDEVYEVYRELDGLLKVLRSRRLTRVSAYRRTLIRAAIADLVFKSVGPDKLAEAEDLVRNMAGWERPLELLKELRGLQYYLR